MTSTAQRFQQACTTRGYAKLAMVCELQKANAEDVMACVRRALLQGTADERYVAVWLCGELGHPRKPRRAERVRLLGDRLSRDRSTRVQAQAARSLGLLGGDDALQLLLKHVNHPQPRVQVGVAQGLQCIADDRAAHALVKLSSDAKAEVREWATFGLANWCAHDPTQLSRDALETVRAALVRRVNDADADTRWESIWGLCALDERSGYVRLRQELNEQPLPQRLLDACEIALERCEAAAAG